MVKLFCAIVGQKGSEFAVEIEESKLVDDLKKAIKNEQMYEFASSKLQLYLGKTKDDTWLDSSAVEALTTDANGHPEGFTRMDPLSLIKNPMNFGERFEFKEYEIHVLVVVPEVHQRQIGEERAHKKARTGTTNLFIGPSSAGVAEFREGDKAKHSKKLSPFKSTTSVGEEEPLKESTFDSPGDLVRIKIDGIYLDTQHLKRSILVEKLHSLISTNFIVLLSSPAASGKSSLFKLYQAAKRNVKVIGISFMDKRTPSELLFLKGIDFEQEKISKSLENQDVVVFMDDAQNKHGEVAFWELLIKGTGLWMPANISFIISATHSLSGGKQSPIEFTSFPRLSRIDFLLTDEEAYQLLEFQNTGLPGNIRQHKILKDVLVKECGGLVGALRLSIDALRKEFFTTKSDDVEETLCLQYCLTDPFVQNMARCFGSAHSYPVGKDFKRFLKDCFENKRMCRDNFKNLKDEDSYSSLKKAGILVELSDSYFGFSSPLAKRYYFKWIFPNRSQTAPSSLQELIRKVVSNMSSTVLKSSSHPGDFPKEATFQHLFLEGLALHTPPDCCICSELSKIFPSNTNLNSQKVIANEIDFYLNGSLHWGIELLVNGGGTGEHLSRFSQPNGKYMSLAVNDYAIVDFCRNVTNQPTNISKNPNRVYVFFKNDDYSVAQCLFGEDTAAIEISLAN